MSDKTLRYIIASVIAMLLVFQVGSLISSVFGMTWGLLSGAVVAVVSFVSSRLAKKAGGKRSFWFLLPTLLFTVFPITFMVWKSVTRDTSGFDRLVTFTPFIVGFVLPVLLLLVVYYELRKRTNNDPV